MAVGYQRFTADGALGSSGLPVVVHGINVLDDGTAATLILHNGTSASDENTIQEITTASVPKTVNYASSNGVVFPNGCFVDVSTHISAVTVFYKTLR